ncbi:MAG: DUF4105 domain-containing protein [Treponema sp.]|nr:DUF4105 domain-containing protein [Treponema sp.]
MKRNVFFVCVFLLAAALLPAQDGPGRAGDNLVIRIAVMGPGDELYFWWGHIALIIDDTKTGESDFYDYGLFSFENENFFTNFALGRLLYSCGVSPSWLNIAGYIRTNRDVIVYTLDLPPEKREEIRRFAENNVLPENRDYLYHHFKKNCSHPIRDIVDMAVDGQFREKYGEAPGRFTLREHVRRHTWFSPFMDWLLNFLMGQDIDVPITVWDDMFLPSEVGNRINEFYYTDPSGAERKLVSDVEILHRAKNRPAVLDVPRRQWPMELTAGTAAALVLLLFFLVQAKRPAAGKLLLGFSQSLLGLFFGGVGLVLFFMTFFTNHDYTFHNSNLLFVNPLLLAALPLGIGYALGGKKKRARLAGRLLRLLWRISLIGLIVSVLIKILPGFYQDNLTDQLLLLPIVLVLSFTPQKE